MNATWIDSLLHDTKIEKKSNYSLARIEYYQNEENRKKQSDIKKALWATPEFKEKMKQARNKEEYRNARKELWNDPEYRRKTLQGRNNK
jgi:hypothetical protein